jgi:hypothetical protein
MDSRRVRLTFDIEKFDETASADVVDRGRRDGILVTTMADLGAHEPYRRLGHVDAQPG